MLVELVEDTRNCGRDWQYIKFGVAMLGNSVLNALEYLGQSRHECLEEALEVIQLRVGRKQKEPKPNG